jgi:hypothetical protein
MQKNELNGNKNKVVPPHTHDTHCHIQGIYQTLYDNLKKIKLIETFTAGRG